ncbi:hypothetical protein EBZ80_07775 [bacterium]|nr:hypothetical protein [bacterium]
MIHIPAILLMFFTGTAVMAGPAPLPLQNGAATAAGVTAKQPEVESDGRVRVGESGFSMKAPEGWTIRHDVPGVSLVLEAPAAGKETYRRTIQVRIAHGARYLDSLGISEFQQEITDKLGNNDNSLREFSIRNAEVVKMDDGREALLVYSGFKLNNVDLLQAHVLIPSAEQHAVVTFTDVAETFNSNAADSPLGVAWAAMTTSQLPGENPGRFAGPIQIAALAGAMVVLLGIMFSIRNALARRAYAKVAMSADDAGPATSSIPASNMDVSSLEVSNPGLSELKVSNEDLLESSPPDSISPRRAA